MNNFYEEMTLELAEQAAEMNELEKARYEVFLNDTEQFRRFYNATNSRLEKLEKTNSGLRFVNLLLTISVVALMASLVVSV